jgi:hypothetical protein
METPWPFVICNKCGLRTVPIECDDSPYGKRTKAKSYTAAKAEAIAAWNTRPPASEPVPEVAGLVERLKSAALACDDTDGLWIAAHTCRQAAALLTAQAAMLDEAKRAFADIARVAEADDHLVRDAALSAIAKLEARHVG